MSGGPLIELRSVTKRFNGHTAVAGVSLEVKRGELFSLLGPSGCGKTTTLRLIAGFERPDTGSVWLAGTDVTRAKPYERNVTTVFQNYALFPHLTARQNVEFGLKQRRASEIAAKVQRMFEAVQLTGKEERRPAELSGGEKQRVALARALVVEPEAVLLDEPLSALDPNLRSQVRQEMRALQKRLGVTFLLVTHDREEALSISDRIAVMNQGCVEQIGTPEEVYRRPRSRFVAEFLGEVTWIDGKALRPEQIRVRPNEPGIAARVVSSAFFGSHVRLRAEVAGGREVTALVQPPRSFVPGEQVYLSWDPGAELELR